MEVFKCRTDLLYNLMQRVHIKGFEMYFKFSYFKVHKSKTWNRYLRQENLQCILITVLPKYIL